MHTLTWHSPHGQLSGGQHADGCRAVLLQWGNTRHKSLKGCYHMHTALGVQGLRVRVWNTCRDVIRAGLGAAGVGAIAPGCEDAADVAPVAEEEPVVHREVVVDYGSDSDLPLLRNGSLARRRSLIHLRESRRRDSINTMCAPSPPPCAKRCSSHLLYTCMLLKYIGPACRLGV